MEPEKQALRIGTAVIVLAAAVRLISGGALQPLIHASGAKDLIPVLTALETGRLLPRYTEPPESLPPETTLPPEPNSPLRFGPEEPVSMRYDGDYRPEPGPLLTAPLEWDLTAEEPAVLILHTHGCESFDDVSPGVWRTTDPEKNMIAVGDRVAQALTERGISVVHDRALHDYPSYNRSYANSREAALEYLEQYPSLCLILDLHRDAADVDGGQLDTSARADGQECAQIMVVAGSDEGGLEHPRWKDNLALGLKLSARLEQLAPGISRYVSLRTERFNQDLGPHALLIEIGAAGNTLEEALRAGEVLAHALGDLAPGANIP